MTPTWGHYSPRVPIGSGGGSDHGAAVAVGAFFVVAVLVMLAFYLWLRWAGRKRK